MKNGNSQSRLAGILLLSSLVASPQNAAAAGELMVYGAGAHPCSMYNETKDRPSQVQFVEWVQGYLTAYAAATNGKSMVFQRESVRMLLDTYCEKNPDKMVMNAAMVIVDSQRPTPPAPAEKPRKRT